MRILITIVHHWNPQGGGKHASLRPDPTPRLRALEEQLLALRRLSMLQGMLNIRDSIVEKANQNLRHQFKILLVTDGQHHLYDQLNPLHQEWIEHVPTQPENPKHLGFEAQRLLKEHLDEDHDLYAYFEDDLIIHDPFFFHKIAWFQAHNGNDAVLLPHRMELLPEPDSQVDRLYIDGPITTKTLNEILIHPSTPVGAPHPNGDVVFVPPDNPHSGCFVLKHQQMKHWSEQDWFLDGDCSFVSPLESAATLGVCKTFRLYKPHWAHAAFLELQHWGASFQSLLTRPVNPPEEAADATSDADAPGDCD